MAIGQIPFNFPMPNPNANPSHSLFRIPDGNGQMNLDRCGHQDLDLVRLTQDDSISRDEFVGLSAQQNEISELAGAYSADGRLSDDETAHLNALRSAFMENVARYREGDHRPAAVVEGTSLQAQKNRQSGMLFDKSRSGKLSIQDTLSLRMRMSRQSFDQGAAKVGGASLADQNAQANDRLAGLWRDLSGHVPPRPVAPAWQPGSQ